MRARRSLNQDRMGWGARIAIALAILVVLAAIGVTIYGGTIKPQHQHFEQIVPDEQTKH